MGWLWVLTCALSGPGLAVGLPGSLVATGGARSQASRGRRPFSSQFPKRHWPCFSRDLVKKKKSRGLGSPEMLTDTEYTSTEATAPWLQ